jgi:acetyl esterase/lipase
MSSVNVPFDPELEVILNAFPKDAPMVRESIPAQRKAMAPMTTLEAVVTDPSIVHESKTATGPNGEIEIAILRLKDGAEGPRPAIYYMHGGAMIFGSRFFGVDNTFEWIKQLDVVISVEYRLAPEFPDPAPRIAMQGLSGLVSTLLN